MIYKIAFFITIAAIEYLATTSNTIEAIASIWDKAKHAFAFFVLYIQLSLAYKNLTTLQKFLILFAFGVQIELVQSLLPYRYFSLLDILADTVGIFLAIMFIFLYKKIRIQL